MKCIQIESSLKLNLMTMDETFIFFDKQGVFKKYQDWSCIHRDRNEQWMKHWFSSKYKVCSNSIKTEAVFTKTEMNNEWNKVCLNSIKNEVVFTKMEMNYEWNIDFSQNTPLGIQYTYSSKFFIGQSTSKTFFFVWG